MPLLFAEVIAATIYVIFEILPAGVLDWISLYREACHKYKWSYPVNTTTMNIAFPRHGKKRWVKTNDQVTHLQKPTHQQRRPATENPRWKDQRENNYSQTSNYRLSRSKNQGPVVQSVVSLTSSLRVISLTVLVDSIYNILIFFAEKMWVAFHIFSAKHFSLFAYLSM